MSLEIAVNQRTEQLLRNLVGQVLGQLYFTTKKKDQGNLVFLIHKIAYQTFWRNKVRVINLVCFFGDCVMP